MKAITAGGSHSVAVLEDGTVWTWGENEDGTYEPGFAPKLVPELTNVKALAAGSSVHHSLVVLTDGTVRGWGDNYHGQLGDGTSGQHFTPTRALLP